MGESKNMVEELRPEGSGGSARADPPQCLSLAWSADGQTLFAGYSDKLIRVWQVSVAYSLKTYSTAPLYMYSPLHKDQVPPWPLVPLTLSRWPQCSWGLLELCGC